MDGIKLTDNMNIASMQYAGNRGIGGGTKNQAQQLPLNENIKFENAYNKAKQYIEINDTKLSLSYDKENKEPVIYVMDSETDEVIRRIPPEKLVEFSGDQELKGLFIQKDA